MKFKEPSEYNIINFEENISIFNLTKIKNGIYPAIITIDGFLNEDKDDIKEWEITILKKYPNNSWYHLNWQSENRKKLLRRSLERVGIALIPNPFYFITLPRVAIGLSGITKTWKNALRKSEETGSLLSKVLLKCEIDEYILIGHSLGSRVIFNCLNDLKTNEKKIIKDVHLLGGAVTNNKEKWSLAENAVKNKIYNYYSKKDSVLQIVYKLGTFDNNPIGRTLINSKKSENINVTKLVNSHMTFKKHFGRYIK
ncbi:DUF726 domain-containing protein [Marinifilum sp. RC60d5]|uniref:DUF726 domain-containing protein n=1 Tax=Marinifilum sp. RC60d5 TaxID=3458414 RepID=UPI0040366441